MKSKRRFPLLILISLGFANCNQGDEQNQNQIQKQEETTPLLTTVEAIRQGTKCTPDHNNGGLKCDYEVGEDLTFTLWGVGKPETAAIVGKSVGEDGDYTIRFVKDFPCLVITAGEKIRIRVKNELPPQDRIRFAFNHRQAYVSPGNGYAYSEEEECVKATKALKEVENEMGPAPFEEQKRELDR